MYDKMKMKMNILIISASEKFVCFYDERKPKNAEHNMTWNLGNLPKLGFKSILNQYHFFGDNFFNCSLSENDNKEIHLN